MNATKEVLHAPIWLNVRMHYATTIVTYNSVIIFDDNKLYTFSQTVPDFAPKNEHDTKL